MAVLNELVANPFRLNSVPPYVKRGDFKVGVSPGERGAKGTLRTAKNRILTGQFAVEESQATVVRGIVV